jgi:hypothetical protein
MDNQNFPEDTPNEKLPEGKKNKRRKGSALLAASIGRSATAQVHRNSRDQLASTGTNISYEGATAPGAGGSVGTGFSSGKEALGETIHTSSDYEIGHVGAPKQEAEDQKPDDLTLPDDTEPAEEPRGPVK